MKKIPKNFEKKRKLLLELNSNQLTKNILYHINEARSSPKEFSHHLINENDEDNKLNHLYTFFKFYAKEVPPLIQDKNLDICSKDLLHHLISIDNGSPVFNYSEENKMRNSLRIRLKRLNLIPTYYVHFLIIGAQNCIDAIINLLLNVNYRNKILSPEMHYIGIASGLLPSENLCIIIDIVNAIKINNNFNFRPVKYSFYNYNNDDDYENECDYSFYENYNKNDNINNYTNNDRYFYQNYSCNNMKPKTDKKVYNMKRIYNSVGYSHSPYMKKRHYDQLAPTYQVRRVMNESRNVIGLSRLTPAMSYDRVGNNPPTLNSTIGKLNTNQVSLYNSNINNSINNNIGLERITKANSYDTGAQSINPLLNSYGFNQNQNKF